MHKRLFDSLGQSYESSCEPTDIHALDKTWIHMSFQGNKQEGAASQECKSENYPGNERPPHKYAQLH